MIKYIFFLELIILRKQNTKCIIPFPCIRITLERLFLTFKKRSIYFLLWICEFIFFSPELSITQKNGVFCIILNEINYINAICLNRSLLRLLCHYSLFNLCFEKKWFLFRIDYASTEKEKVHHWLFHAKYKIMKGYFFHILTAWIWHRYSIQHRLKMK